MAIDMLSYAIGAKSGGGGGGGDCNLFPVTMTVDYDNPVAEDRYTFTADKTFAEIAEAIDAGKMLLIIEGDGNGEYSMNVASNVYHELGSTEITFNYTYFSLATSSTWDAFLHDYVLTEDEGYDLTIMGATISVT